MKPNLERAIELCRVQQNLYWEGSKENTLAKICRAALDANAAIRNAPVPIEQMADYCVKREHLDAVLAEVFQEEK
jgi:hypothetical protein